jgi:hypothetical protein
MSAEAPQPTPEEQRRQQVELRQGQEAQLFANYMIKDVVDAIGKEVEPGQEFERMPLVLRKTAEILGAYDVFENLINPYVEATNLAKHWTSIANEAQALATNPEGTAHRIKTMEEELADLAAQADFAGIKKRVLQRELGDMDLAQLEAMTQRDEQFMKLQALTQEEIQKRHKKDSMRVRLSNERQRLSLISESTETLQEPESQERLKRKAEQAQDNGAAVIGLDEFMRYFVTMEQRNFGIDDLGTAAIDGRVEKLSSRRMEKLLSRPGLKEGVDKSMWIMLNLDVGRDIVDGQEVLPNFKQEGYEHTRNYCAIEYADNQTLEEFRKAMMAQVKSEIADLGEGFEEEADNLARLAVDFAMAYHDSMLLSSFYDTPRDPNSLQPIKVKEEDGVYVRAQPGDADAKKVSGNGIMLAKLPTDTEKIFDTRNKLRKDSSRGYKAPLPILISTMPDFLMTDLVRTYSYKDKDGETHHAFEELVNGDLTLSEMYSQLGEVSHVLSLLGIFNAVKAFSEAGEMPDEIIQLLPEDVSMSQKVIEAYGPWVSSFHKRLEKCLKKVYTDDLWKAETTRVVVNASVAFFRRIAKEAVQTGGKGSNTEGENVWGQTTDQVLNYMNEWLVQQTAVLTQEQFDIFREFANSTRVTTIAPERVIEGGIDGGLTALGEIFAERNIDQEDQKEPDSSKVVLSQQRRHQQY